MFFITDHYIVLQLHTALSFIILAYLQIVPAFLRRLSKTTPHNGVLPKIIFQPGILLYALSYFGIMTQ